MVHVSNGLYKYEFASYDDSIDYVFQADGGATLPTAERYQFGNNEIGQVTSQADAISANHASELAIIAGLVQRNQRINSCTYGSSGELLTATLAIYGSASDASAQTSPIKQFSLSAVYNVAGNMTDYLMTEV